jgi:hypothetical protein
VFEENQKYDNMLIEKFRANVQRRHHLNRDTVIMKQEQMPKTATLSSIIKVTEHL